MEIKVELRWWMNELDYYFDLQTFYHCWICLNTIYIFKYMQNVQLRYFLQTTCLPVIVSAYHWFMTVRHYVQFIQWLISLWPKHWIMQIIHLCRFWTKYNHNLHLWLDSTLQNSLTFYYKYRFSILVWF